MLYERWREIAEEFRGEPAVHEVASRRLLSFSDLASLAEAHVPRSLEQWVVPQGHSVGFILDVLAAWRMGRIVCPADSVDSTPAPPSGTGLPPGCTHLKTTSATTGRPRLIAFTGSQLAADAASIVSTMGLRRDWPNLGAISLAHSYGFSNLVLPLLLHGIPLILAESPLPSALEPAARLAEGVVIPGVPALWRAWDDSDAIPPNVRLAISAGAPLPLPLEREIHHRRGLKIHNFYGSSECGGIAFDASDSPRNDPGCVGTAMDGVRLTVATDGCLEVRGPGVGLGYWPVGETERLGAGCFHTRDLAEIRGREVCLQGRAGDLINVAGRKVAPEQIERALTAHPSVRGCLAFGVPSGTPARGDHVVAVVACSTPVRTEVLKDYLLALLPDWQVPREWWLVDELPASSRGKLSRPEWRDRFLRERGNRAAAGSERPVSAQ